jgi:hypothetical protein
VRGRRGAVCIIVMCWWMQGGELRQGPIKGWGYRSFPSYAETLSLALEMESLRRSARCSSSCLSKLLVLWRHKIFFLMRSTVPRLSDDQSALHSEQWVASPSRRPKFGFFFECFWLTFWIFPKFLGIRFLKRFIIGFGGISWTFCSRFNQLCAVG